VGANCENIVKINLSEEKVARSFFNPIALNGFPLFNLPLATWPYFFGYFFRMRYVYPSIINSNRPSLQGCARTRTRETAWILVHVLQLLVGLLLPHQRSWHSRARGVALFVLDGMRVQCRAQSVPMVVGAQRRYRRSAHWVGKRRCCSVIA
jgi:hypothetical protein